ncbi:MAG TPA: arginine deiminase family protein [Actinomycetota bacterium]|jgi:dimethylargininase|nr:arginine deiminase family protein [Actinomycetota bacterium]
MKDKPRYAIVRPPADSFFRAVSDHKEAGKIDPKNARRQHENFRYILEDLVGEVVELPKNERFPDSCFTQDTAIVLKNRALLMRTATPSRRGEEKLIAKALAPRVDTVDFVPPPGTVECGDMILLGNQLLVGRSRRTTPHGIDFVKSWAGDLGYKVVQVEVPMGVLHLTTAISVIHDGLVMGLPHVLEHPVFDRVNTLPVYDDPIDACNVLVIGDRVIASGEYKVHELLEKEGFTVSRPDLSEFIRANGGPSCLAILIE